MGLSDTAGTSPIIDQERCPKHGHVGVSIVGGERLCYRCRKPMVVERFVGAGEIRRLLCNAVASLAGSQYHDVTPSDHRHKAKRARELCERAIRLIDGQEGSGAF